MGITINTSVGSAYTGLGAGGAQAALGKAVGRLSSGMRIQSGADDPAGLAILDGLKSDAAVLRQTVRNVNDAVSTVQVVDGMLSAMGGLVANMRSLAQNALTDPLAGARSNMLSDYFHSLGKTIDKIVEIRQFSGHMILDTAEFFFANGLSSTQTSEYMEDALAAFKLSHKPGFSRGDKQSAATAISHLDKAAESITAARASLGADAETLETKVKTITSSIQGLVASESRIVDANVAAEVTAATSAKMRLDVATTVTVNGGLVPEGITKLIATADSA